MAYRALTAYLDALESEMHVPAYDLRILKGHEEVYSYRRNCDEKTVFWFYSSTKLFTVTAALRLAEKGALDISAPVSRYIPEFASLRVKEGNGLREAATVMTVEQLFSMTGGMSYDISSPEISSAEDRSTLGIVRAMAGMPLFYDPGEGFEYSLCHDVLAGVIEVVSGMSFGEYLKKEITGPLGMESMTFHPDEKTLAAMAPQCVMTDGRAVEIPKDNVFRLSPEYESGGAGLCGTAADYILLPDALANGGKAKNGCRLLSEESVKRMSSNRLNALQFAVMKEKWPRFRAYGYGMGVRTRLDASDGGRSPVGEFGWDGAAGCYSMIDPVNDIAMFYVQHVLGHGESFDIIHPKIRDLVYED